MHLSHEEKARLIDGALSEGEREKYLKHIAECRECFEIVTDSALLLRGFEEQEKSRRYFLVVIKKRKYISLLAAAVLLVAAMPFLWRGAKTLFTYLKPNEIIEVSVEKGSKESLTLSDGTRITLDAGSVLRYPEEVGRKSRSVHLNGEAFFEVVPDKGRPFVIEANHARIQVLGTRFNVSSWDYLNQVAVVVAEGEVSLALQNENQQKGVLISGGEYSVLKEFGAPTTPQQVDISEYTGWLDRTIDCHNTPLRDILFRLERWHNVQFIVDDRISVYDLITLYVENKPIQEIMDLIACTWGLEYRLEGRKIYLF
jgi:ferric-dicitrate binding protein FerR (iron transport regulator)